MIHYADADEETEMLEPLCRGGLRGDRMTWSWENTTCPDCRALTPPDDRR